MILRIKDNKTDEEIYCCVTEGNPEKPSRIEESGSKMQFIKDAVQNKIREQDDYIQDAICSSSGAYQIADIFQNAINFINKDAGEELYTVTVEDLTYPVFEEDTRDDKFIVDADDLILTRK